MTFWNIQVNIPSGGHETPFVFLFVCFFCFYNVLVPVPCYHFLHSEQTITVVCTLYDVDVCS